jgi:hypothetical protein
MDAQSDQVISEVPKELNTTENLSPTSREAANLQSIPPKPDSNEEIITLLREQNRLSTETQDYLRTLLKAITLLKEQNDYLSAMQHNLAYCTTQESDKYYHFRSYITDINMSIGAMMSFMLKWLVASIPVGIIVGIVYFIILAITGNLR